MVKFLGPFILFALFPFSAFAASTDLVTAIVDLGRIVNLLIPLVIGVAILYFIWGLAQYILKSGEKEGREGARDIMVWGIIVLFVVIAIWGLVQLLAATLKIAPGTAFDAPAVGVDPRTGRPAGGSDMIK